MTNREATLSQWDYCEANRGIIVLSDMKREIPRRKGFIRTSIFSTGFIIEQGEKPNETKFTHIFCTDPMVRS
jgi:hypothetical protein